MRFFWLPAALCGLALPLVAQQGHLDALPAPAKVAAVVALPDAPQSALEAAPDAANPAVPPVQRTVPAKRFAKSIDPEETTKTLTPKDKLAFSFGEQASTYSAASMLFGAGWEHLLDSNPKYGTNAEAFGKRLGVAAIRQTSQAFFTDGVFANVFHQDPRYYRKGSGSLRSRALYAGSRVVITRQDSGTSAPNYSLFFGHAATSALTMAYYPAASAKWSTTAGGYGFSMLANAFGNAVHEFGPDVTRIVFHRHN